LPKSIDESDGLMNSQQDEHMEDRTQRIDTSSKIPDSSKDRSSSLLNVKRPSSLRNLSESVQAEGLVFKTQPLIENFLVLSTTELHYQSIKVWPRKIY
jgi:hypothetical protein